ncbi:MAG: TetR/AcrR family transcriptional regulator [Cellulomonadaceae bacterium]|nr:TetR/AcrR family transcriptional regulator [Cellulomonadaceae bacterium]
MPKIIGGSLTEHREQTRTRLFEALTALMGERGFDAITLADIAQAAGVGRTAVYNHFADKESLLLAFIHQTTEDYVAGLEQTLAGVADPVLQLRTYVRQNAARDRSYYPAPGPDLRSMLSKESAAQLRGHAELVEGVLRRILLAGIATGAFPDQPVEITVPLVNACLNSRAVPGSGPERDVAIAAIEMFVLRAVGAI